MDQDKQTNPQEYGALQPKREWVTPEIEVAKARGAEAFGGPPGGVDYGFYS